MKTKRNVIAYRTPPATRIAATASDDFLKEITGVNIDLSSCPSVTEIPESSFLDDRFAPLASDGSGGGLALKRWLRQSQKAKDAEVSTVLDRKVRDGALPRQSDDPDGDSKEYFIDGEPVR